MTQVTCQVFGLFLLIGLAPGFLLAQPSGDMMSATPSVVPRRPGLDVVETLVAAQRNLPTEDTKGDLVWTFDAGGGVRVASFFFPTGWVSVGSDRVRLQVDYAHGERRAAILHPYLGDPVGVRVSRDRLFHVSISRHFRAGYMVEPRVFVGGGHLRFSDQECRRDSDDERFLQCDEGTAKGPGPVLVAGVGFDVSFRPRLFLRIESRGFTFISNESRALWAPLAQLGYSMAVGVWVGGGVRF